MQRMVVFTLVLRFYGCGLLMAYDQQLGTLQDV